MPPCRGLVALVLAGALLLPATPRAQPRIRDNSYAIDFHRGPVIGSGRAVGLGGAMTALGEGVDAVGFNPASVGLRPASDTHWFAPDATVGLLLPDANWDNSGDASSNVRSFSVFQLGGALNFGNVGVGYLATLEGFVLGDARRTEMTLAVHHLDVAAQLFDGQLGVGAGWRYATFELAWPASGSTPETSLARAIGGAPEVGATWRPERWPFRIGAAWRAEVSATPTEAPSMDAVARRPDGCAVGAAGCFVLPQRLSVPWELEAGVAVMFGPRRFNVRWRNPHDAWDDFRTHIRRARAARQAEHEREVRALSAAGREAAEVAWRNDEQRRQLEEEAVYERYKVDWSVNRTRWFRALPRRYLLVSASVLVAGAVERGNGLDASVAQVERASGRGVTASVRLGVEAEPWTNRLQVRLGGYLEPSRFEGVPARVHVTGGADLRLFEWDVFGLIDPLDLKLSGTFDVSHNYTDWGVSVGFWH